MTQTEAQEVPSRGSAFKASFSSKWDALLPSTTSNPRFLSETPLERTCRTGPFVAREALAHPIERHGLGNHKVTHEGGMEIRLQGSAVRSSIDSGLQVLH